jgi:ribose-phosphate pyrophosphokinase
VLSGPAVQRIEQSVLREVVVTNSIAPSEAARKCQKIRYLSIGKLLGEAIRRIQNSDSVSSLFV